MIQGKKYNSNGDKTKLYADLLMTFSLGATVIIMGLPISDTLKAYINATIACLGLGGKLLTNIVDFNNKQEQPEEESK